MGLTATLEWLQSLPLARATSESTWIFPAVESIHVIAISLVVGSILIVDLRLLGLTSRAKPVTELTTEILPWTWGLFVIAAASGFVMFMSKAVEYSTNKPFLAKLVLIALAGLNMLVFHTTAFRSVHEWDRDRPTLRTAKVAGVLSLGLWIAVVACGRWIAFVPSSRFGM